MSALPLEASDVYKSFGDVHALEGVSLEVREGEILGLLGPNGAGKTTLVRAVAGRVVPDSGRLTIFGKNPGDPQATAVRGWVPQEIALYPLLTPRENLWTFGRYQGLQGAALHAAVAETLGWIGLADRASDKTSALSGGMRRRLNIAAGTIHRPRLLLLDEPTVGVDPQSRERIYAMIRDLQSRGVALLYTTHYMEEAERLCDRIAIIDHGRVIASGTRDELVRSSVGTGQSIRIDADTPIPPPLAQTLARFDATVDGATVLARSEDPARQIRELLGAFHDAGVPVRDLVLKRASLEEVFLQLTGRELRE